MSEKERALELAQETAKKLVECGTLIDEYYRKFREIRLITSDLSFQSALLNVEHSFFMVVQSMNVLRDHLRILEVAVKKKEIE